MTLDQQLRALKATEGRATTPPHLEARLLAAFEGQRQVRGQRSGWPIAAALAAGVILGAALTLWNSQRTPPAPTLAAAAIGESVVFVLEPPGVQEAVRVVRIRVARSALESLGIQTVASSGSARGRSDGVPADSVEVDVLVGEDGVARGVRLAM